MRLIALLVLLTSWPVHAGSLICAEDKTTFAYTCFDAKTLRQNGEVRAARMHSGGPAGVRDTGFTARVHCQNKILELTDRQGVAFARNRPTTSAGHDFVRYMCEYFPTKQDKNLRID
jgi:hypothetical protein